MDEGSRRSVSRRALIKGIAGAGTGLAVPQLLSGCTATAPVAGEGIAGGAAVAAGAPTIITWVSGVASVIGAIPAAVQIAHFVAGHTPSQVVAREVRKQLAKEKYTNENGAFVYHVDGTYFFAAATDDGAGGCAAFIRHGAFLQLIESRGAAALKRVAVQAATDHRLRVGRTGLVRMFMPVEANRLSKDDLGGSLERIGDVFRYKAHYGTVAYRLARKDLVEVSAKAPTGKRWTFTAEVPPHLEA